MNTTSLIALHGMMGSPTDFNCFSPSDFGVKELICPKLFNLEEEINKVKSPSKFILGYSLGGRIALNLALNNPTLFKGLIIVSSHPGLKTDVEREVRLKQDYLLIDKINNWPLEDLLKEWEAQEVFQNSTIQLNRSNFDRDYQAALLSTYSLGRQENLLEKIGSAPFPILWLTGEHDLKYKALAEEVRVTKKMVLKNASHRALFENKGDFIKYVRDFIQMVP